MKIFIGMETGGMLRSRFAARGHEVVSCDMLPAEDDAVLHSLPLTPYRPMNCHIVGDVFEVLEHLRRGGWWPDMAVFHPTCTYLTGSAEWAYGDGPYHQKVKPGTLVGAARREARELAINDVLRIWSLPIKRKAVENPVGTLSTRWRKPTQIIQPNWFGDDASKKLCLWLDGLLPLRPTERRAGRWVEWPRGSGKMVERWSNQTDSGQNRLSPGDDRWKDRSRSFPGVCDAMTAQWI